MLEKRLSQRREPTDAAFERLRFVFADNAVRGALPIGRLDRYARTEPNHLCRLLLRPHDDSRIDPLLQLLGGSRITRNLCGRQLLPELLVAFRRHVVRMLALRTLRDDFGFPFVLFDKCAAHGKLTYTRFRGKQDGGSIHAVLAQRLERLRALL